RRLDALGMYIAPLTQSARIRRPTLVSSTVSSSFIIRVLLLFVEMRHPDGGETLCSRSYLIAPRRPSRPRLTGEQFDPGKLGIHTLDERIGFIWLAAVLAARRVDHRWRALGWCGRRYAAARGNQ